MKTMGMIVLLLCCPAALAAGKAGTYDVGGAAVLELARSGADLKGFATFHGGLEFPAGQDCVRPAGKS